MYLAVMVLPVSVKVVVVVVKAARCTWRSWSVSVRGSIPLRDFPQRAVWVRGENAPSDASLSLPR